MPKRVLPQSQTASWPLGLVRHFAEAIDAASGAFVA
jgi:hypothetical protein